MPRTKIIEKSRRCAPIRRAPVRKQNTVRRQFHPIFFPFRVLRVGFPQKIPPFRPDFLIYFSFPYVKFLPATSSNTIKTVSVRQRFFRISIQNSRYIIIPHPQQTDEPFLGKRSNIKTEHRPNMKHRQRSPIQTTFRPLAHALGLSFRHCSDFIIILPPVRIDITDPPIGSLHSVFESRRTTLLFTDADPIKRWFAKPTASK